MTLRTMSYLSLFLIVLSCGPAKSSHEQFIPAQEFGDRFSGDLRYGLPMHEFQSDEFEIVFDRVSLRFGIRNKSNNKILRTDYTYLAFVGDSYLIAEKNGLYGIVDVNGHNIIPIAYDWIRLFATDRPFIVVYKDAKQAIFDLGGKEIYPFIISSFRSETKYKNKHFFVAELENYKTELLIVDGLQVNGIVGVTRFESVENGLAWMHYVKQGKSYFGAYNMESNTMLGEYSGLYFHKERKEIWAMSARNGYKTYDTVIDSTFSEKPNRYEGIFMIANDVFYIRTKQGVTIMNTDGKIAPFSYPKIEPFSVQSEQDVSIHGKKYSDFQKTLLKFYNDVSAVRYGIIDTDGNIIADAGKYDYINVSNLDDMNSYNRDLPIHKQQYLRNNKLDKLFYARNYNSGNGDDRMTILRHDGSQVISFPIDAGDDCYLELSQFSPQGHLMAKCGKKMKIYDLAMQKLVFETNEPREHVNFKERYHNGYYHIDFGNLAKPKINYLSNKLKLLYVQEVPKDSLWHKMINDDKIYFTKNGKVGLVDFAEKEIVPAVYDSIYIAHPDFNIVLVKGKYGVITNSNKMVIAPVFDKIVHNRNNQSFDCYRDGEKEIKLLTKIE